MAVIVKCLIPDSHEVDKNVSSMSLPFLIRSDRILSQEEVKRQEGVPVIGSKCPLLPSLCAHRLAFNAYDGYTWKCVVQYSSESITGDYSYQGTGSKPWNRPPVISYEDDCEMVVQEKCYADDDQEGGEPTMAILNPAGDPYDNPPQVPRRFKHINIRWNVRSFKDSQISSFLDTINSNPVTIDGVPRAARTLYLETLLPQPMLTDDGVEYVEMTARITYKPWGFNFRPLEMGYNAVDPSTGKTRPVYVDQQGKFVFEPEGNTRITEPVLLNENGRLLVNSANEARQATPVYGNKRYLKMTDWKGLAVPSVRGVKP